MTGRLLALLRSPQGVTIIEMAVVLFIVALIAVPLAGIASRFLGLPTEWQANMTAMRDAREAVKWVADDARQAACFYVRTGLDYGTFTWIDYAAFPTERFEVTYFYDTSTTSVMREEAVNNLTTTRPVIDTIAEYDDFQMWWTDRDKTFRLVRARATATTRSIIGEYQRTHLTAVMMRPSEQFAHLLPNCP